MNDDIAYTVRVISDIILSSASYNTIVDQLNRKRCDVEHDNLYEYDWNITKENDVLALSVSGIDLAETVGLTSTIKFDTDFVYFFEEDTVQRLQMDIRNIRTDYRNGNLVVLDFIEAIVENLVNAADTILGERGSLTTEDRGDSSTVYFSDSVILAVGFKKVDNAFLSIKSLTCTDLHIEYAINCSENLEEELEIYSEKLPEFVRLLIENQHKTVFDDELYDCFSDNIAVDFDLVNRNFHDRKITGPSSYLFNTQLNLIKRAETTSMLDFLVLFDGNGIELSEIIYRYQVDAS
jgi:hypothetical protein